MDAQSFQYLLALLDPFTAKQRFIIQRFLKISMQQNSLEKVLAAEAECNT